MKLPRHRLFQSFSPPSREFSQSLAATPVTFEEAGASRLITLLPLRLLVIVLLARAALRGGFPEKSFGCRFSPLRLLLRSRRRRLFRPALDSILENKTDLWVPRKIGC